MEELTASRDLASCRALVAAATMAVRGLGEVVFQAVGSELGPLLGELDGLGQACAAAQVAVVAEAVQRGGLTTGPSGGAGPRALSAVAWVVEHAPSFRAGGARAVVSLAEAFVKPSNGLVAQALAQGRVPVRSAAVVVDEMQRLRPLLAKGAEPHVAEGLLTMVAQHGPSGCRVSTSAGSGRASGTGWGIGGLVGQTPARFVGARLANLPLRHRHGGDARRSVRSRGCRDAAVCKCLVASSRSCRSLRGVRHLSLVVLAVLQTELAVPSEADRRVRAA